MARILIVDDDAQVRLFLREVLEDEGYTVDEAVNGEEGARRVRASLPDLLITDIFMPAQDGIGIILWIRKKYPQLKIIAISGGGTQNIVGILPAARDFGAQSALHKPFTSQELVDAVRTVLV